VVFKTRHWLGVLSLIVLTLAYSWLSGAMVQREVRRTEAAVRTLPVAIKARPVQPTQSVVAAPAIRLIGVVSQARAPVALIEVGGARAQLFEVGDAVSQDWKLEEIQPDHIVAGNADKHVRFELEGGQVAADREVPSRSASAPAAKAESNPRTAEERAQIRDFQEFVRQRTQSP
jgi:hypothetical protein